MTIEQAQRLLSIPSEKWRIVADAISPDLYWSVYISKSGEYLIFQNFGICEKRIPITKKTSIITYGFWKSTKTLVDNDNPFLKRFNEIWNYCTEERIRKDNEQIEQNLKKFGV